MNIDKENLNRNFWYEDVDGNVITKEEADELDHVTYHSLWPLQITEEISDYSWYPETKWQKFICKFKPIYRHLKKKNKHNKTFHHLMNCNSHIGGGNAPVIMAMVNSGDYTLSEALYLWSQSCERCMNVLAYKYLNGEDGYEEFSEEWKKCHTVCSFCRGE